MSDYGFCQGCRKDRDDVVVGLCGMCALFYHRYERATVGGMTSHNPPTYAITDPKRIAADAFAILSALARVDLDLASAALALAHEIRDNYPEVSVDPGGPIDPGVSGVPSK